MEGWKEAGEGRVGEGGRGGKGGRKQVGKGRRVEKTDETVEKVALCREIFLLLFKFFYYLKFFFNKILNIVSCSLFIEFCRLIFRLIVFFEVT